MKFHLAMAVLAAVSLAACDEKKPAQAAKPAQQQAAASQEAGPPLVNGVYVEQKACPGEGCEYGSWRATKPVALLQRADVDAGIVATLVPQERVEVLTGDLYVVPLRGVASRDVTLYLGGDERKVKKGETVYRLGYSGEGVYFFWHRGAVVTPSLDDIDFARLDADPASQTKPVWWVQMKRANGQTGWVRNPDSFECVGKLAGDLNC